MADKAIRFGVLAAALVFITLESLFRKKEDANAGS